MVVVTPGPILDMAELAHAQESCQETQELGTKLTTQDVLFSRQKIWCDNSLGVLSPIVPVSMRRLVFNSMHSLAQPGIHATRHMLTSRFVWTSCSSDVNTWYRECQQCARAKIQSHKRAAVEAIPVPLHRFLHVHVDLVGPWPWTAEGHTHLLTIVDRTTRWAEAIPLQSTTAQVVAYSFVVNWMARTREPSSPVLRGSACGQACADDCIPPPVKQYGEAFLQLKAALHARCSEAAWLEHLPWVLLGLRASPKYETGVSSAEATYGHSPMLPSQL